MRSRQRFILEKQSSFHQVDLIIIASLTAIKITALLTSALMAKKIIGYEHFFTTAGVLMFPLMFYINDIAAEIYGYKIGLCFIVLGIICEFVFVVFTREIYLLPSPSFWNLGHAYHEVIWPLLHVYLSGVLGGVIGAIINLKLLLKWKTLLKSRFFWLRSLGSTIVGEFVFTLIVDSLIFIKHLNFYEILTIISGSMFLKIIFTIVFSFPAVLSIALIRYLRRRKASPAEFKNPFAYTEENKAN